MLSWEANGKLDDDDDDDHDGEDDDDNDGLPSGVFASVFQNRPRKTKKTCGKDQPRKSTGDGAPKLQISVPCRGRTRPDKFLPNLKFVFSFHTRRARCSTVQAFLSRLQAIGSKLQAPLH